MTHFLNEATKECGTCPIGDRVELTCEIHGVRTNGDYVELARGNGFRYVTANNEQPGIYEDETGQLWEFLVSGPPEPIHEIRFGRWRMKTGKPLEGYWDLPGYNGVAIAVRWIGRAA